VVAVLKTRNRLLLKTHNRLVGIRGNVAQYIISEINSSHQAVEGSDMFLVIGGGSRSRQHPVSEADAKAARFADLFKRKEI
jgi:hypothetical protein